MSISKSEQPIDDGIIREKIYVPPEMMKIIQKYYTTWEAMEDIAETIGSSTRYDIKDLEKELEKIKKLYSELKAYDSHCANSYSDALENIKHQIRDKFPGIQNNELFKRRFNEYWFDVVVEQRTVNDFIPVKTADDVEIPLKELYEEIVMNKSKGIDALKLCTTSFGVCRRVRSLQSAVESCRCRMEFESLKRERGRERKELDEKQAEAWTLEIDEVEVPGSVQCDEGILGDSLE